MTPFEFAAEVHRDQCRKFSNLPYIVHPVAVAELARSIWLEVKGSPASMFVYNVGLLHDTVEDGTPEQAARFVNDNVLAQYYETVVTLSKLNGEPIDEYNRRIYNDYFAYCVKLADISCNLHDSEIIIDRILRSNSDRNWLGRWVDEKMKFLRDGPAYSGFGDWEDSIGDRLIKIQKRL